MPHHWEVLMKRKVTLISFVTLALIFCLHILPTTVCAEGEAISTVDKLLAQSGYSFAKKTSNVWTIDYTGKSLAKFKVIISTGPDLVVMFVTIAKKAEFPVNTELLYKLARINHSLDRIKAGLDDDGDIFVRIDLSDRILDIKEFKVNVDQLAAAADQAYADIKPFIKPAK
jgi:hypothetical protein